MRGSRAFLMASSMVLVAGVVAAQGTITDAPANFVRGTSPFDSSPGADFTGVSATLTQDHVFEFGWAYRVSGDTQETFFPVPTNQSYVGSTSTISWTDVSTRGLFDAVEVTTVTNSGGPGGHVVSTLTLTNISASPLSIDMFVMLDFDIAGAGSDSAVLFTPANYVIEVTDPSGNVGEFRAPGANAYLVRAFGATDIGAILSDTAVTNFDNTGLPFAAGDFTGGYQWTTVTIPVAGSRDFTTSFAVNDTAVPVELGSLTVD